MENRFIDLMSPDKSFRVSYVKDKLSNNQSNNQFHDYLELFYQLSGERHYFIKDQVFNIHKGDLVLINELELHRTTASRTPTYSRVLIHFRKSLLTNFLEMIRDIDLKPLMTESYHVTVCGQPFLFHHRRGRRHPAGIREPDQTAVAGFICVYQPVGRKA